MPRQNAKGFTLVELSLVLVVIGLLIGAIVVGSGMIKGAELSSLMSDTQKFRTSMHSFKERFRSLPGDMPDATDYWTGTGNGDADGLVGPFGGASADYPERFRFWQHLALAGLIEGNYTGVAAASGSDDADISVNVPEAAVDGVGFYVMYTAASSTVTGAWWPRLSHHNMWVGTLFSNGITSGAAFSTKDTEALDSKFDDGRPGHGDFRATANSSNCVTSTTDQDAADYNFGNTDERACAFNLRLDQL